MSAARCKQVAFLSFIFVATLTFAVAAELETAGNSGIPKDAEAAWEAVQKALRPPPQPPEWRTNPPSQQLIAEYERKNGMLAGEAADKAKDFYTRFPTHPKALEAARMELQLLDVAIQLGETNRQNQFDAAQQRRLNDPKVSPDEKFDLRAQQIARILEATSTNRSTVLTRAEKAADELRAQFPKRDEAFGLLLAVAQAYLDEGNTAKARTVAEGVADKGGGDAKDEAQALIRKINRVGKPLELGFTDLTGKRINLENYVGKVVLIDFWATWCGPCVAALPEVKNVYQRFHSKGFEIVGVSLDKEKEALVKFTSAEKMSWPQYFDGLGWDNEIAKKYEITGIPALWLLDKKGNLRDMSGGHSLESKVEKLLAEK